jgi:phosphoribosylaminoimidazole-succinocarboxamide synthase
MTSVKDFRIHEPATPDAPGRGAFVFTDAYSVFDWGPMPDPIPDKGASLCTMGAFNFELLEDAGVPTHYRGVVHEGETVPLDRALDAGTAPREMGIDLTQVPDLPFREGRGYDYDAYHREAGENYLVPLEIVFRNRVGVGSSLRDRTAPADHGLDHDEWPDAAVDLGEAIVEFSTKYEEQDRYLDRERADDIAGEASVEELEATARAVNRLVTEQAERAGLVHQDGKIECAFVDGDILVADVVGTFDENRFSYDGKQVSKEVVRQYHKRTQPAWVEAVSAAKAEADRRGVADWKSLCDLAPDPLDDEVVRSVRDLYCAGTNAYCQRQVFESPSIDEAVATAHDL